MAINWSVLPLQDARALAIWRHQWESGSLAQDDTDEVWGQLEALFGRAWCAAHRN